MKKVFTVQGSVMDSVTFVGVMLAVFGIVFVGIAGEVRCQELKKADEKNINRSTGQHAYRLGVDYNDPLPLSKFKSILSGDLVVRGKVLSVEYICSEPDAQVPLMQSEANVLFQVVEELVGSIQGRQLNVLLKKAPNSACTVYHHVDGPREILVNDEYVFGCDYSEDLGVFVVNAGKILCVEGGDVLRCGIGAGFDEYDPAYELRAHVERLAVSAQFRNADEVLTVEVGPRADEVVGVVEGRVKNTWAGDMPVGQSIEFSIWGGDGYLYGRPGAVKPGLYIVFLQRDKDTLELMFGKMSMMEFSNGTLLAPGSVERGFVHNSMIYDYKEGK